MKISLVIPTYNEREGLRAMVEGLSGVLARTGIDYELVIVDDSSPDGTGELADELAREHKVLPVPTIGTSCLPWCGWWPRVAPTWPWARATCPAGGWETGRCAARSSRGWLAFWVRPSARCAMSPRAIWSSAAR
ncbi:glycosyltransferase [bacterium CPR1]|nr:glycosyltransferase [bacterium CPR1]